MFRPLTGEELTFLKKLLEEERLPELFLDEPIQVEYHRVGKQVKHGRATLPPATTICILKAYVPNGFNLSIGASVRSFKDRENSTVGERIALVRAIRSRPIGLNP